MRGVKSLILGSFMAGCGSTILITDIILRDNKYYKLIKNVHDNKCPKV